MNVNVQTIFWMDAFLYLMLHAAIWYGLARFRSPVVVLWSASGIFSALGVCVLGSMGWLSVDVVVVVGQFLMAAGNWGRQIALRSLDGPPASGWMWTSGLFNLAYLSLSYSLQFSGTTERDLMLLFYSYYTLNCVEYYLSGRRIGLTHDTIGATSVKWAGMVLVMTLGIKTLAMLTDTGAQTLYELSWDQVVVFAGQFTALIMLCVGFIQIFIDKEHRAKMAAEQGFAREQARAALALQHSEELTVLLTEREEIIRQLTLSSKSAGMGALVASFAHELNQPLTANLLHAELLQNKLATAIEHATPVDLPTLNMVATCIASDTQRAGEIIRKLRNLFRMSKGEYTRIDFHRLVQDVLDLVKFKMLESNIRLSTEFDDHFRLSGDVTQLQQVVLNLLNNAIDAMLEHRTRSPHLKIRGKVVGDFLDIEVEDNGKGIEPERHEDVFSLFKTSKSEGMGVGLWLSRSIVEMHGGRLSFQSEPGLRTVFTLRLPSLDGNLLS